MARSEKMKTTDNPKLEEALVIKTTGSQCIVQTKSANVYSCVVSGKFRIKGIKSTNPVAVGDKVMIQRNGDEELAVIKKILPRNNYILRQAIGHNYKVHILAANLDQAIFLFTIHSPATSYGFTNRFLVTAEAYHIPVTIVINKLDLIREQQDKEKLEEVVSIYKGAGYEVKVLSAIEEEYKEEIIELLKDKITFIGGHSGSGKSTLVNLIDPSLDIKTGEISSYSDKGQHTTTFAQMYPLAIGGYLIDSPGIKELGLVDFKKEDLSHYFPEMRARLADCKFNNCLHINEPGCAVKAALEKGEIHESRYKNYLKMMEDLQNSPQH